MHSEEHHLCNTCTTVDAGFLLDLGRAKENNASVEQKETSAEEKLQQLATLVALGLESYPQPGRPHSSWRSQWRLKLHQWRRTTHTASSIEREHNLHGWILIHPTLDFHAQIWYTESFHPIEETNLSYDRQTNK